MTFTALIGTILALEAVLVVVSAMAATSSTKGKSPAQVQASCTWRSHASVASMVA
jgi:hypothetical protein